MFRAALALVLSAICLQAAEVTPPCRVKSTLDIAYVPKAGERQKLDIFRPEGMTNRPVVMMIHGGTWMIGDKNFYGLYRDVAVSLAKDGFVVVAANYRLSPWVKHPEHVKDVARAFTWTRKHIREHGGDPDTIVLLGHSAGGHLVSLLATDPTWTTEADRKAIRGVVSVSGVYSIPKPEEVAKLAEARLDGMLKMGGRMPGPMVALAEQAGRMFNPFPLIFGNDPKTHKQASPMTHIKPGLPPFLVLYAEKEMPFIADMSREFTAAMQRSKNEVELIKIDKRNHNTIFFDADSADDPVHKAIVAFVQQRSRN
jgi:acetyl esterase/lipase